MRAELASPYPGQVAKSTARLLKKLNVSDALLAASGADVAVLLKVLSSAENTKAVLPDPARLRSPLPCSPASAPPATAPREGSGNLRVRYVPAEHRDAGVRATSARPCGPPGRGVPGRRRGRRRRMNAKKRLFLSGKAWNKGLL